VVAYQNFGGAVDKALSARKSSDVSTIETSLQQYRLDKGSYPKADIQASDNLWGFNDTIPATQSNTVIVTKTGEAILTVTSASTGGWEVQNSAGEQIGSKWTISQAVLTKKYLTADLYDPELGDVRVGDADTMMTYGIGRYVYAIYNKDWINGRGSDYNIALTLKKDGTTDYVTKIVWTYDSNSCTDSSTCPDSLVGPGFEWWNDVNLKNGTIQAEDANADSGYATPKNPNQGIPYGLTDFVE